MNHLTVFNDVHLGVQRTAGTTQASAIALREWQQELFRKMLNSTSGVALINGDLFDGYSVPLSVVRWFIHQIDAWLRHDNDNLLILARGNHDISKDNTNLSSFDFTSVMLKMMHGERVRVVTEPSDFETFYIVPHMANQDLFNLALDAVPDNRLVFLHANFDNNFAVESDHSLNVSAKQAEALILRGCKLLFAHEHQQRKAFGGNLQVSGNQIPTSIADCLGNPCGLKHHAACHYTGGPSGWSIEYHLTWAADGDHGYAEIDWRDLPTYAGGAAFIRVIGDASAEQSAEATAAIARFRRDSQAFVVSNAVVVEGVQIGDMAVASVEAVKAFNPIDFLVEHLEKEKPEFAAKVRQLWASKEAA